MDHNFGFTNDATRLEAAKAWRQAAMADGWTSLATYVNHESEESCATLERDGWKASVCARIHKPGEKWKYQAEVSVWAPDGLSIQVPKEYPGMEALTALMRRCNYCHATDVPTQRVSFAGRCCAECIPAQRKRLEYRGWCD